EERLVDDYLARLRLSLQPGTAVHSCASYIRKFEDLEPLDGAHSQPNLCLEVGKPREAIRDVQCSEECVPTARESHQDTISEALDDGTRELPSDATTDRVVLERSHRAIAVTLVDLALC